MFETFSMWFCITIIGVLLSAGGCSIRPPSNIHQPMTAKPVANQSAVPADGAIFHAGVNEQPLFEDMRARKVGDILTIQIVEKISGNRKSSGSSSSSNSINATFPKIVGGSLSTLSKAFPISSSSSSKAVMAGGGAASEDLTGVITVTVIEVLANGNLLVSGEEQVALNQSDEYIRFSGVVKPTSITGANTVLSTQVADAHIEYKNAGAMNEVINDAKSLGFLGRFFQSVLPF